VSFLPIDSRAPKPTLLIADDEPAVLNVARSMASALGWRTMVASNGDEALKVFREQARQIQVVLLDLRMPKGDGAATFAEMRRIDPQARIVVMTGDPESISETPMRGPAAILPKPFHLADLQRALDEAGPGLAGDHAA